MKTYTSLALALALPFSIFAADSAPGYKFVRTVGGISEYTLDSNKLTVLLKEDHSAPVLTLMVTYRVGSRNEVIGTTGATHILEHLMFKGSKNYNREKGTGFDTLLDKIGATNNASTWLDRTNYYEQLASDQLELAIKLEVDRMRDLLLRDDDRKPEMTVVRNEYERGENDPTEALDKEIWALAFLAHPYHHSTIGWRSDIEGVSIEKLREFYNTFYWPNNATVSIIGDFKPLDALALLRKYYGAIKASPTPIPTVYTEEPPQQGPRRTVVKRPGEVGVVGVAYKIPPALNADYAPLVVLGDILTDGKTSRMYGALTDKNITLDVSSRVYANLDNTLFQIFATLTPPEKPTTSDADHRRAEVIMLAEMSKVIQSGVTAEEVQRSISKQTARTAFGRDGTFAIASELNEYIASGDWAQYDSLPNKIRAVTAADVQRVAKKYLVEDQSTTGYFIPLAEAPGGGGGGGPQFYRDPDAASLTLGATPSRGSRPLAAAATAGGAGSAPSVAIAPKVNRRKVAGIDVLTVGTTLKDVVTITGSFPAGDAFNPTGRPAIADLATGMLDKGTVAHDKFAVAQMLEDVGAGIGFGSGTITLTFNAKSLKKDVPLVISLLAEQLRTPRFSQEEFDKLKRQAIGELQQQMEQPDFRATQALTRAIYPEGHPNRGPDLKVYLDDLNRATLADVRAFYAANYGPANMTLVAVGDIDDTVIDSSLTRGFSGWSGGRMPPAAPKAQMPAAGRVEKVAIPGKTSVYLAIGQPSGLKYSDTDRIALDLGSQVFGGGYFSSRLLATVRNIEGLTYGIGAGLQNDTYVDGQWVLRGTFAPALLEKGTQSALKQLKSFYATGITADELRDFKAAVIGSYKLALATSGGLASQILINVQRGMPVSQIDDYPGKVNAVTLEQVNGAIKKYLNPDRMITVEAGTLP